MSSQQLDKYIEEVKSEFNQIPDDRRAVLKQLTAFVQTSIQDKGKADLILICTHNSRRSHLSQVWAQVAAFHFGINNVCTYSGGTEATAMYHMAAHALEKAGLEIKMLSEGKNPVYSIKYHHNEPAIIGFSKTYDDSFNVQSGFAAVMTCSHADANCPFIPTASKRISLPFEDPKDYDGTPQQEEKYDERCKDIAREMLFVFSNVKS
ncbi:protein-tyrosine-phosphatase [Limibacter armeniacum]|uniref:arsenate-mycothiol transferase ArsC n=1 Tax=Limibacter armeniacum TaxID=466084 RepID=UPI002FE5968E